MVNHELRPMSLVEAENELNTEIAGKEIQKRSKAEILQKMNAMDISPEALKTRREKAAQELFEQKKKNEEHQKFLNKQIKKQKEREEGTEVEKSLKETRQAIQDSIIEDKEREIIANLKKTKPELPTITKNK